MIIKVLHGNDSQKLEMIYDRYAQYIYRVAMKRLGNEELAKDCTQQSYEKIIRYLDKIDDIDSKQTKSYIYMIVKSVAIDIQRKEKNTIPCDYSSLSSIVENSRSHEELNRMMVESCQGDFLLDILKLINEDERKLLILKFGEDRSYEEVGQMLGISEGACRKRIMRIKEKIVTRLAGQKGVKRWKGRL